LPIRAGGLCETGAPTTEKGTVSFIGTAITVVIHAIAIRIVAVRFTFSALKFATIFTLGAALTNTFTTGHCNVTFIRRTVTVVVLTVAGSVVLVERNTLNTRDLSPCLASASRCTYALPAGLSDIRFIRQPITIVIAAITYRIIASGRTWFANIHLTIRACAARSANTLTASGAYESLIIRFITIVIDPVAGIIGSGWCAHDALGFNTIHAT